MAPPQTPFANRSFPDACSSQSASALGNPAPCRPSQESVPGAWGAEHLPCWPVSRSLCSSTQHLLCAEGMQGIRKCSPCPPGLPGPAGQMLVQGSWKSRPGEAGLLALKGQLPFAGVEHPPPPAGSAYDLRAATRRMGHTLAAATRAGFSGPCPCTGRSSPRR